MFLLFYPFLVGLLAGQIHHTTAVRSRLSWPDGTESDVISCETVLVESVPENLTYSPGAPQHLSTIDAWNQLLTLAKQNLYMAEFYWSLQAEEKFNFSATIPVKLGTNSSRGIEEMRLKTGKEILKRLIEKSGQIKVKIAQNGAPSEDGELAALEKAGAEIFWIDVTKLLGSGIIHTKMWTVDENHAYLGSANTDWRALTEVKELGVLFSNCQEIVADLNKINQAYWLVSQGIPKRWPDELTTIYNAQNPMRVKLNGVCSLVYFSSSPTAFNPPGRTYDLDAIVSVINKAEKFVYISVMNYVPEIVKYDRKNKNLYWPVIDDALRSAAIDRGVEVRLMVSLWPSTPKTMSRYLQSLRWLNGIQGARIRVPTFALISGEPSTADSAFKP
ncbi:unnamed protein product [Echinostoma caproni]|uniref:PLD phosphodiesterase domain-containing protein n=1 Tax=Echinostoma caproni TaxID=27848 RepID=A0A183A911_9TREM|nr:unnamed protein product [Echinostoma caproni]